MKDAEFLIWLHDKLMPKDIFNRETLERLKKIASRVPVTQETIPYVEVAVRQHVRSMSEWK